MARRDQAEGDVLVETGSTDDVDVPSEGDGVEGTAATSEVKEKKEPARPPVPEGYLTPVGFAKELTKHLESQGATDSKGNAINEKNPIPPQQMYSTIKNAPKDHPFPTYEEGGRVNLIKLSEGLAWWDEKTARVAEKKANAAAKNQAKAERAAAKAAGESSTEGEQDSGSVEETE